MTMEISYVLRDLAWKHDVALSINYGMNLCKMTLLEVHFLFLLDFM